MKHALRLVVALGVLAISATAAAATPVSPGTPTTGVATLELLDPVAWTGRSIDAAGGIHFRLCDRGSLRPCALRTGAVGARRQAYALALTALRTTPVPFVVVALPQASGEALLVFERDVLGEADPLRATGDRVYLLGGLVPYSPTEDSLLLVRLRLSPGAHPGR